MDNDIEKGIYNAEDMLPQPTDSSLKISRAEVLIINQEINEKKAAAKDNMNRINSFWLQQERLLRYTIKLYRAIAACVEAQVDGGPDSHIFTLDFLHDNVYKRTNYTSDGRFRRVYWNRDSTGENRRYNNTPISVILDGTETSKYIL